MKKLFILAPVILLTAMIYSAEIEVMVEDDNQKLIILPKLHQIDLNTETFNSLAQRIYNTAGVVRQGGVVLEHGLVKNLRPGFEIGQFDWKSADGVSHERVPDSTTLSEVGIYDGQIMFAVLVPIAEETKEPDVE